MGEMDNKVVLVTGATNGIGKAAALELAKKSAKIVIVGRSAAKTQATVSEIKLQSGSTSVESLVADLSSLADVRRLADEFRQRLRDMVHPRLRGRIGERGAERIDTRNR